MKIRIVDCAILAATMVGAVMAFSTARKLHGLQAEYARLSRTTGELNITDPAQLHVQAIETGDPLHFAWRIYAPAGRLAVDESSGSGSGGSSTSFNSEPREFIARIRFSEYRSGTRAVYSNIGNSSGMFTYGSPEVWRFLKEHQDELDIEQLGAQGLARVKPGEAVTLLRVRLPDDLVEEARKKLTDSCVRQFTPHLFECNLKLQP